jgi:hypothetical protein
MRPLYASNPWALAIYWALIALWLVSEASYFMRRTKRLIPGVL